MPNDDPRKHARENIQQMGSLSRKTGTLPSDVSGRNLFGTALRTKVSDWRGAAPHFTATRNKSDQFKQQYNQELQRVRRESKRKLENVHKNLKKYNRNTDRF